MFCAVKEEMSGSGWEGDCPGIAPYVPPAQDPASPGRAREVPWQRPGREPSPDPDVTELSSLPALGWKTPWPSCLSSFKTGK